MARTRTDFVQPTSVSEVATSVAADLTVFGHYQPNKGLTLDVEKGASCLASSYTWWQMWRGGNNDLYAEFMDEFRDYVDQNIVEYSDNTPTNEVVNTLLLFSGALLARSAVQA